MRSRSSRRRRGGAWAGLLGLWWPGSNLGGSELCCVGGAGEKRCPLACKQPRQPCPRLARCARHSDIFLADRAFVVLAPSYCPVSVLALFPHHAPARAPVLLTGGSTGCFSSPSSLVTQEMRAIGHQPRGKRPRALLPEFNPSLVFSSTHEPDLSVCASGIHLHRSQARCSGVRQMEEEDFELRRPLWMSLPHYCGVQKP